MNPICKILGHKYEDSITHHGPWHCARCGDWMEDYENDSLNLGGRWYMLRQRALDLIWRKTRWFFKCPDCGKRWGKHDDSCVPF